jgi:phosphoribosylanthranilate isomerase
MIILNMQNVIQIAGIIDFVEAEMLLNLGVDWLGFPLRLPVHREDLTEATAAKIIACLKPPHRGVLITYLNTSDSIRRLADFLGCHTIQIHGPISILELANLRTSAPHFFLIKSLIVKPDNFPDLLRQAQQFSPYVDGFITDTHDPITGADGATGKTHDWRISRMLVEQLSHPLMLAGGLTPENVYEAILQVQPAAVDAHTGVEASTGRKCPRKVAAFVENARRAFRDLSISN